MLQSKMGNLETQAAVDTRLRKGQTKQKHSTKTK